MPDEIEPVYDLVCQGPGPHDPPDGVLGTTSIPNATGGLCAPCAAIPVEVPPEPEPVEAVDLATTIAIVNDLRAQLVASGFIDPALVVMP